MAVITYNGYQFPDLAHVTIAAEFVYDDAERTVTYHRYKIRVQAIILAEAGDATAGDHFRRIRQKLSKAGQTLKIDQAGFGPTLLINNGSAIPQDVAFGPKPRMVAWDPVGNTNAVEVIWECETCIPVCDGAGTRFAGIGAINYAVSYRLDKFGFTTRTVSGYIEIGMTRVGVSIPDTADAYREFVNPPKPYNFERESDWQLSADKRRVNFTITDSEIRSPNTYPEGVIAIRASHRAGWSVRQRASLPNTLSATIYLTAQKPRGFAWEIFRNIVISRLQGVGARTLIFESIEVEEELFDYAISFTVQYRILTDLFAQDMFVASSIFTQINAGNWQSWAASTADSQNARGLAKLQHNPGDDQIVDFCTDTLLPGVPQTFVVQQPPPTTYQRLCNEKPSPNKSWLRFEGTLTLIDDYSSTEQITIGGDDVRAKDLDPSDPSASVGETTGTQIKRYVESAAPGTEFDWTGYAERIGYDIPRPDKIKFGNKTLVKHGKQYFSKKLLGVQFCQPVYAAAWKMRYIVADRPNDVQASEADPVNGSSGTSTSSVPQPP